MEKSVDQLINETIEEMNEYIAGKVVNLPMLNRFMKVFGLLSIENITEEMKENKSIQFKDSDPESGIVITADFRITTYNKLKIIRVR